MASLAEFAASFRSAMMIELYPCAEPWEIEARSFARIDAEVPAPRPFVGAAWSVARRLIHTCGDMEILPLLVLPDASVEAGIAALRRGAPVFTDTEMARCGIPERRMNALGTRVRPLLCLPGVNEHAIREKCTRSRAALLEAAHLLPGAIVAIGNAPTALLALLEMLEHGLGAPALIIGMPVGFVNAAESKELLCQSPCPHLCLRGRKGGSPLAAACVNALAELALQAPEAGN
jgi:precorrin-8X/cobalt-precorrin-8 methylmutase